MTTIATVRSTMGTAVATITGLRAYDYIQDTINAPCAHIVPLEYDPRYVFSAAKVKYPFQVRIYVDREPADQNQKLLDGYREMTGSTSVLAGLQLQSNWSGVVDDVDVIRIGEVSLIEVAGIPYLYLEIDVDITW